MNTTATASNLLRLSLKLDGVMTLPSGVLVAALAGVLADPLGIPTAALVGAGLFFVVWGAAVLLLGTRPVINRPLATGVAIVNLLCALDGIVVVTAGIGDLTTLGAVLALALSATVAALGGLQLAALRR